MNFEYSSVCVYENIEQSLFASRILDIIKIEKKME